MFYTMGNHMGKFLLLVTQMVLTYWCEVDLMLLPNVQQQSLLICTP